MSSFKDFLLTTLSSGSVLGVLVYFWFEYTGVGKNLEMKWLRLLVAVFSGFLGVGLWSLGALLEYLPITSATIGDVIWTYGVCTGVTTFTSASLVHGFTRET